MKIKLHLLHVPTGKVFKSVEMECDETNIDAAVESIAKMAHIVIPLEGGRLAVIKPGVLDQCTITITLPE